MSDQFAALEVKEVVHKYRENRALDHLSLEVAPGEIFAILGPNGSGKTTLFRLVSTLARVQEGSIRVFGACANESTLEVRSRIGIVFQSPSLDKKLTVIENLRCQAALYGLAGKELRSRCDEVLRQMGLEDRIHQRCQELSGGYKRRVELAKGLLHKPSLLLLDEPSTGLDPAARLDLWHALTQLQQQSAVTIILTTHLLEEAEKASRIAILHRGKVVALDTPEALRRSVAGEVISIGTHTPDSVCKVLAETFKLQGQVVASQVRVSMTDAVQWIGPIAQAVKPWSYQISIGQPSLEDVFIARTGHRFWEAETTLKS